LDQVHSLLLTNFYLYFGTEEVIYFIWLAMQSFLLEHAWIIFQRNRVLVHPPWICFILLIFNKVMFNMMTSKMTPSREKGEENSWCKCFLNSIILPATWETYNHMSYNISYYLPYFFLFHMKVLFWRCICKEWPCKRNHRTSIIVLKVNTQNNFRSIRVPKNRRNRW
jgi:hypothetical protein